MQGESPERRTVVSKALDMLEETMSELFGSDNITEAAIKSDRELMEQDIPFRLWMAVCYRLNMKEIYLVQRKALESKLKTFRHD